jgi:hypothetical protein
MGIFGGRVGITASTPARYRAVCAERAAVVVAHRDLNELPGGRIRLPMVSGEWAIGVRNVIALASPPTRELTVRAHGAGMLTFCAQLSELSFGRFQLADAGRQVARRVTSMPPARDAAIASADAACEPLPRRDVQERIGWGKLDMGIPAHHRAISLPPANRAFAHGEVHEHAGGPRFGFGVVR